MTADKITKNTLFNIYRLCETLAWVIHENNNAYT